MANADKSLQERSEYVATNDTAQLPPRRQGGAIRRHFARFWWIYLIIFCLGALIVVLPFVYVGIPNIAQSQLNKSSLNITNQVVTNPTPNSVDLTIDSIASSNSSFHPKLSSFNASLFLEDTEPNIKPFGYITIPNTHAAKNVPIHASQTIQVADMDQFKAYNTLFMNSEEFRIAIRGKVDLKLKGLKAFKVDYNKAVTMKGLNGLSGFAITDFSLVLNGSEPDGANLVGTVYIPNPSVLTVELGNVTMNLAVDGQPIGTSLLPNLTLKPGNNTVPMRSFTNTTTVLNLISGKYKNGLLPIDITGNSSVNSQGEHLTYYEAAIQANHMQVTLDVGKALQALGLNVTAL